MASESIKSAMINEFIISLSREFHQILKKASTEGSTAPLRLL